MITFKIENLMVRRKLTIKLKHAAIFIIYANEWEKY